ncbi:MAG: TRAP transporter substrate-binding protein DctP [Spirochaetes bacterium]|nr:MAG: TRAP transporter substrate-binding protein DctP [Spirochaetota bacterium]
MKKFKVLTTLILTAVFIFTVLGIATAADKTYVLRFNTVAGPNEPQTLSMKKFAEVVSELSGGKIKVKVFHSGQLADQKTGILGVMRGSLEMTSDASPSWFSDLANYPEIAVLEAAYIYRDLDHLYRVLTGPFGQKYWDTLARKSNIRVLDIWYLGTRELNLTRKAGVVRRPEDLKGIKLRMPNTEAWLDVGRALGANPTPLGFGEVYMALKTGTIDGQDNPLPTDYSEKFCEVTHYIVLTDHVIGYITPIINEKLWQSMPENYRFYIKQAMRVARFYQNEMVLEQEAKLLGIFQKEYGMEIIVPDKKAFMEHARRFYSQPKFDRKWGKGMYARIQTME